jgi:hypothetical protein
MKKIAFSLLALTAFTLFVPTAHATPTTIYDTFTGSDGIAGSFERTGNTGTIDITKGVAGYFGISAGGPFAMVTVAGDPSEWMFQDGSYGTVDLIDGTSGWYLVSTDHLFLEKITVVDPPAPSATPEPSSVFLLGSGLLMLALGLAWKSRSIRSASMVSAG